jgi:hypothetical protein
MMVPEYAAIRLAARGSLIGLEERGHLAPDRHLTDHVNWDSDRVGRALNSVNYTHWEEPSADLIAKHRKRRINDFNDAPISPGLTNVDVSFSDHS